jgi:hypothetical protein
VMTRASSGRSICLWLENEEEEEATVIFIIISNLLWRNLICHKNYMKI